jgi:hypothetical protein
MSIQSKEPAGCAEIVHTNGSKQQQANTTMTKPITMTKNRRNKQGQMAPDHTTSVALMHPFMPPTPLLLLLYLLLPSPPPKPPAPVPIVLMLRLRLRTLCHWHLHNKHAPHEIDLTYERYSSMRIIRSNKRCTLP